MCKLNLEKAEESEIKLPIRDQIVGSQKKQGNFRKTSASDYAKDFVWITENWKIPKEMTQIDLIISV